MTDVTESEIHERPQTPASDGCLSVRNLTTVFTTKRGTVAAVTDVSFDLRAGETLGIVGESGSGKSVTAMSILGLIPKPPGKVVSGEIRVAGKDLLALDRRSLRAASGTDVAMIFQDPMTSLNPVHRIGAQIAEGILTHQRRPSRADREAARQRAVELLAAVGVPAPERRARQYPHELSGGMRQRVMIAMAMSCDPKVLIADEPTTALDATIQAQIMRLLREVQQRTNVGIMLITHDIGLVAQNVDRVLVMYGGRVVEMGTVQEVLENPKHPYTVGLLQCTPSRLPADSVRRRLTPIPGLPPNPTDLPPGCSFAPRCGLRGDRERCLLEQPELRPAPTDDHRSACHFLEEVSP
ncbi:ABC transporter ATP-binding protein [Spongiactinospora sp. TRM90649]|uniref:ABC transporter ATP-binding protein n=1 Tax=Spongiactinospora sp. TRM90649 TaxID=3031114 RepID=UPI0023F87B79|nr:ABC transporter ATP-binding protein [Spongiactinospora sp. TRM90649]MDF5753166.1 ABC transporter ATP-binding protein [Spongiactinospora sp. TRM90649]